MNIQLGEDAKSQPLPPYKVWGTGSHALFHYAISFTFCFLRDQNQPFLRTVIQIKLANSLPAMLVTSDSFEPLSLFGVLKDVKDASLFSQSIFYLVYLDCVRK